ncbi:hypothetical protein [Francisella orientalis]|uniref:Uncharacterized protein n=1 Tax=Francisella orientalis TaxID=299583 RepID=A0AAP7C5I8_9GAMM|nr:hypothetical protein [Francisella orientalis]AFJ42617.1 hypothetical protein OOM_0051 [Francisella orientalis str. Toba 04]AHB97776.1 hypothetical protein M973_00660 [Francisella orientalis LADL 07-285A]AKN84868.1 hypothetical protein FNO12_0053 [Francisella orientalis FNO12]AKN86406.1 Hypothetical protein FNO24_0053 [Francisella orientalis FNO24]AKN87944.1 Hypothetical protein FNO190_0053 [Francisella orientalis]
MKRISLLLVCGFCFANSFSANITDTNSTNSVVSGSTIIMNSATDTKKSSTTPIPMNATPSPLSKEAKEGTIPAIDQPKQQEQLVGSNSATWTPAYLSVKKFKKCLAVENYRGWQGYCLPSEKPKKCPNESWDQLSEMNLIPCTNPSN